MSRMPVAARRVQLIEAALRVASRDGIDAATVRAVAAEAGVSLGVVHYCFLDKDELLRAVAVAITTQNLATAIGEVSRGADLPTVLDRAIDGLWSSITANRGAQLLSYELTTSSLRHAELSSVAIEQYNESWAAVEGFLDRIEREAQVSWAVPRGDLARAVVALVDGYVLAWLVDGDDVAAMRGMRIFAAYLAGHVIEHDDLVEQSDGSAQGDPAPVPRQRPDSDGGELRVGAEPRGSAARDADARDAPRDPARGAVPAPPVPSSSRA